MKTYLKAFSLAVAFAVTFFIVLKNTEAQTDIKLTTISEATLPVVYALSDGGNPYNMMHGFTGTVDMYSVCENVTMLPEDRRLAIEIDKYNADVTAVAYEVRSRDGSNLYEDTAVKNYEDVNGTIKAVLNIKNLLDENEEYILKIKLTTSNFEEVSFYTLIKQEKNTDVDKKIDFVRWFRDKTFDRANLSDIKKYIETKSDADNTNFAYVNIYSSLSMFGYGDLDVRVESLGDVYIREISGPDAIVYLDFKVSGTQGSDAVSYNVREIYTLSEGSTGGIYLMGYERYMEQVFDMENAIMPSSRVYFGVTNEEVSFKEDEKQRYTAFVRDGELYLYDMKKNDLTSVFTFTEKETDNVREAYKKHDIKIANISENGDVSFAVYGYMNRGLHEGQMGISVCVYTRENGNVEEIAFVPVDCSFETLKENFGDVIYIDSDRTVTLMADGTIYAIDTKSNEMTVIVDNIEKDAYSVSSDGMTLAYVSGGELRLYSLKDESEQIISHNEDEQLKTIGYIDGDFVYGAAKNADIVNEKVGNRIFPMYKIYILNDKLEVIKEYGIDGMYVVDFEIQGKRVKLTRMKKNSNGRFVYAEIDQLMNKSDNLQADGAYLRRVATDVRKNELYLQLSSTVFNAKDVQIRYSGKVVFNSKDSKSLSIEVDRSVRARQKAAMNVTCNTSYKLPAISRGGACEVSDSLAVCTDIILNTLGRSENVTSEFAKGNTSISLIDACQGIGALNLTGNSLDTALGFTASGYMVEAMIDYDHFVIITGYGKKNITVYDPVSDEILTYSREEFSGKAQEVGNVYVSYYRE